MLVPSGLLALLRLHAAWVEEKGTRRYVLDDVAFSYAPSAYALNAARATASHAPAQKLVAVDEPLPLRKPAPLPNSNAEVQAIASLFADAQTFRHGQATREALLAALPGAHVAHFSCHGGTDWGNALDSALIMAHNEKLTVRDVLALHLSGARLATLSACETGLVGTRLPDEAVALPAALVQAGFAGVVASLWSVSDLSTAMLMEYFYHLWQEKKLEPDLALQQTQRWVRDSTNAEKKAHFRRDLRPAPHTALKMSGTVAGLFLDHLNELGLDQCAFQHPFWWAAFSLTGV